VEAVSCRFQKRSSTVALISRAIARVGRDSNWPVGGFTRLHVQSKQRGLAHLQPVPLPSVQTVQRVYARRDAHTWLGPSSSRSFYRASSCVLCTLQRRTECRGTGTCTCTCTCPYTGSSAGAPSPHAIQSGRSKPHTWRGRAQWAGKAATAKTAGQLVRPPQSKSFRDAQ
jgi:hypothetical protein